VISWFQSLLFQVYKLVPLYSGPPPQPLRLLRLLRVRRPAQARWWSLTPPRQPRMELLMESYTTPPYRRHSRHPAPTSPGGRIRPPLGFQRLPLPRRRRRRCPKRREYNKPCSLRRALSTPRRRAKGPRASSPTWRWPRPPPWRRFRSADRSTTPWFTCAWRFLPVPVRKTP
jgi:hypothetical protein